MTIAGQKKWEDLRLNTLSPTGESNHHLGDIVLHHKPTVAANLWAESQTRSSLVSRFKTERVRFELTEAFTSSDFKSDAFDHSATFPNASTLF